MNDYTTVQLWKRLVEAEARAKVVAEQFRKCLPANNSEWTQWDAVEVARFEGKVLGLTAALAVLADYIDEV